MPIFSLLPPGPRAVDIESPKKRVGFFSDIPTRSPHPRVQLGYSPASSKLRGFGTSLSSSSLSGSTFSSTTNPLISAPENKSSDLFARSSSPALGTGQRHSVKKLILDKKVEPAQLFTKSASSSPLKGGKVTFSPALSVAARESAAASPPNTEKEAPKAPARTRSSPNRFTAATQHIPASEGETSAGSDIVTLEEGDYWVKPDLSTLKSSGYEKLSSFKDLVVGRVGYGEIQFLEPVDLTGLPKLTALFGDVIRFEDKECSVYPDSDDIDKPPPGSGLNVLARISLKRCWAIDKATREPIKDEDNPAAMRHLKKLKSIKDTHFESFNMSDGTWIFTVQHF